MFCARIFSLPSTSSCLSVSLKLMAAIVATVDALWECAPPVAPAGRSAVIGGADKLAPRPKRSRIRPRIRPICHCGFPDFRAPRRSDAQLGYPRNHTAGAHRIVRPRQHDTDNTTTRQHVDSPRSNRATRSSPTECAKERTRCATEFVVTAHELLGSVAVRSGNRRLRSLGTLPLERYRTDLDESSVTNL